MDKPVGYLAINFASYIEVIIDLEKQGAKIYSKLVKKAYTPELTKALSPISTDCEQHIGRLKLIKLATKGIDIELIKENIPIYDVKITKPDTAKDVKIISYALRFQHLKLAYYEMLYPMAVNLSLIQEATLLEQTITDNRNTNTWLRQIIQNIIAPQIV